MQVRVISETLARIGYGARGTVYLIVGGFAVLAALGSGGRTTDQKGALQTLLMQPLGDVLLGLVALGLLFFAFWRGLQAFFDADHLGREPRALARRAGYGMSAILYTALAIWAVRLLLGSGTGDHGSQDKAARDWTAYVMSMPFGQWLVATVGAITVATGIGVGVRGWRATFERHLALDQQTRRWAVPMGQFGVIARAVVFVLIGAFLTMAAIHANAREAKGLGGALRTLQEQPYGWVLLGVTALGLFAFGAFEFIKAVYRRAEAPTLDQAADQVREAAQEAGRKFGQTVVRQSRS